MEDEWAELVLIFWCIMPLAQSKSWRKRNHKVWHCHFTRLILFLGWGFLVWGDKLKNGKKRWWCVILACSLWFKESQSCLKWPFLAVTKSGSLPCGCCEGVLWVTTFVVWTLVPHRAVWPYGLNQSSGELRDGGVFQLVLAWASLN